MFDILNCNNPYGKGYKSPITQNNTTGIENHLLEAVNYLESLRTADGGFLKDSRRKTFVLGFKVSSLAYLGVAREMFKIEECRYLLSFKLSQDHLENFFSKVRSKGGFNNNPDVVNFKSALRSLLIFNQISPSPNANTMHVTESDEGCLLNLKAKRHTVEEETEMPAVTEECENFSLNIALSKPIEDIIEYISK